MNWTLKMRNRFIQISIVYLLNSKYENLFNLNILLHRGIEIRLDFLSNSEWIERSSSHKLIYMDVSM